MSLFRDEAGKLSMSRILLALWTVVIITLLFWHISWMTQPVLTFFSSVYLFLASWAAGPRLAQYCFPTIGNVVNSVGQSKGATVEEVKEIVKENINKG